jgi:hypothetical protein
MAFQFFFKTSPPEPADGAELRELLTR